MSKRTKRTISFLSAVFMLVALSAACGETSETSETAAVTSSAGYVSEETGAPEETVFMDDSLPELDYGGRTFSVFTWNEFINEITVEEATGDVVDDAVYRRNLGAEERLGIKFRFIEQPGNYSNMNTFAKTVKSTVLAGTGDFDLISSYNLIAPTFVMDGVIRDLTKLKYLDFDKPWWPDNILEEMEIDGKVFMATGDISIGLIRWMYCTYFNKNLAGSMGIEDIYGIVRDGRWTLDKLAEITSDVYSDLNGNGKVDTEDRFGLVIRANMQIAAFISSCGCQITSRDENGNPVLNFGTERVVSTIEKLVTMLQTNPGNAVNPSNDTDETTFPRGNTLFYMGYVGYAEKLRDIDSFDFGMIPAAKYDESTESYKIYVGNEYTFFTVPTDAGDPDLSGAVMEALASDSYRNVIPAYYETALKVKYSRDDTSTQMLDMMKANVDFNFGYIFANNIGDNPAALFRSTVESLKTDWVSVYEKKRAKYEADIEKILETIRSIDY